MKKVVKRIAIGLFAVIAFAVSAVVVKFFVLSPRLRPAVAMTADTSPETLQRGKYLVHHVAACVGCHSPVQETVPGEPPVEGKLGAGRDFGEIPNYPVHIRSRNLTPDKATGIGGWSDGEIVRAMREGVSRDGRALFPQMPYLTYGKTLSDADALAIVAYLRTLPPVVNDPGPTTVKFPVSMFIRGAPRPLETSPGPAPSYSDKFARGKWLLQVSSCNDCHDSVDDHMEKIPGKTLAGGMKFPLPEGKGFAIAPNITSDKATGIGAYTDEDLKRIFSEGKGKSGRHLYVMPWSYYRGMTDEDKAALFTALREVPPIANLVPPSQIK